MVKKEEVADILAKKQKEISISEFFLKNRHLLGFDNPTRALMMVVKEAVDNALDACGEMKVLPEIKIELKQINENRFIVAVEDNGPGIVKAQIPNIFGKLLYGSKFHSYRQNRGQQGIGISAAVLYSQLTTGKSTKVYSRISSKKPAHYFELQIDTKKNEPLILKDEEVKWEKEHGTRIEIEIEGRYLKGKQSVDEYVKQTAIVNPHANIVYITPEKEKTQYHRVTEELPREPKEIKPHPYGIELGQLIKMLQDTRANTLSGFLQNDFSRIGPQTASEICKNAKLKPNEKPKSLEHKEIEVLFKSLQEAKIMAPPSDCLSPITAELLEKGLRKEIQADFYVTTSRSPSVYRGMPFIVECGIAYGGEVDKESQVRLMRLANRVPLLYQQGACAITEAITETNWKPYGLQQSGSNMPAGPAVILVHIASVWVPFTNEAKEAIAHYDEIIKEIKLTLQECGRKLSIYINKHVKAAEQREKIDLFEKYIPELASSLSILTGDKREQLQQKLQKLLQKELPTLEAEQNGKEG
ncbi:MAG: DNA topoisomerase VI subunit B [Candidatus Woesearchaeota archaeon]|nr:MAG: DNA topoisomerase VI subunit B [Candidatus Woesearchaeota archaeon]